MTHKTLSRLGEVSYVEFQAPTGQKNLSKITRLVAAIKSLRFALFLMVFEDKPVATSVKLG